MRKKNDCTNREYTIKETILIERLRSFRVPAMVEEYKSQLQDPNSGLLSFEERFTRIVNAEWFKRYNKKFNDKLKKAKLRFKDADLDALHKRLSGYSPIIHLSSVVLHIVLPADTHVLPWQIYILMIKGSYYHTKHHPCPFMLLPFLFCFDGAFSETISDATALYKLLHPFRRKINIMLT